MAEIELKLEGDRTAYAPGETIRGTVKWLLPETPRAIEVQMIWNTEGKGTQDSGTPVITHWPSPGREGEQDFELIAPAGPFTYHGRLISILWSVAAVVDGGKQHAAIDITLSPSGEAVTMSPGDEEDE